MRTEVEVLNELGLHARPATMFVRCMEAFDSEVFIVRGEERFSCRSILEVLTANLDCGTKFALEAEGPDAAEVLETLRQLLVEFRDEELRDKG